MTDNIIRDPKLKVNNKNNRKGNDRRFIKTYYVRPNAENQYLGKVLIISKDEYQNKYVDVIEEPKLRFYTTKPEHWDGNNVNYISVDKVDKHEIVYKNHVSAIAKALNDGPLIKEVNRLLRGGTYETRQAAEKLVKLDGRVHGSDINIEDQYISMFLEKYPDDNNKSNYLRKAFYDIEVDGSKLNSFPDPEEALAPINAISYMDDYTETCWAYILKYDTDTYKETLSKIDELSDKVVKEMNGLGYDNFKIIIEECDNELDLITKFLHNVNHITTPDFLLAWNNDFDFVTIHNRLLKLGQDPADLFSPNEFPYKDVHYRIDKNATDMASKSSLYMTASYTTWLDQLTLYATILKGQKTLESFSLEYIAQSELGEGKSDYDGDITNAFLVDYSKFLLYSIKDTLLLSRLEKKLQHIDLLYYMSIMTATRPSHVMKKTISLRNLGDLFYKSNGYVISNNRSELFPKGDTIPGAFVADPNFVDHIGIEWFLSKSKFIFEDVADVDLASLYPSVTEAINISPETFVGNIKMDGEPDEVYRFVDHYTSGDSINFAVKYLGQMTPIEMIEEFKNYLEGKGNE